jgi:O-antigen ligase
LPTTPDLLAVASSVQGAALVVAVAGAVAALVARDPRRRAWAMLAAPVGAALALATLSADIDLPSPALIGAAVAVGAVVVGALALLILRRPEALPVLAVAALPFRVPVSIGDTAANLLVPLYAVIAAAIVAHAIRALRAGDGEDEQAEETDPWPRRLRVAFAVVLGLYAVQALYSTDVEQAVKNAAFFYVPFALLFLLLAEVNWSWRRLRACLWTTVVLALAFAAIGCIEFATGHLIIANAKVVEANDLLPYFRVNSLFFDPNIYGRYLALTMILLAAVLLWTRRRREVLTIAAALVLLWAGLVFSLSQSSFAALLLGLAVLAALRWKAWPVLAVAGFAAAVAVAVVLLAPEAMNIDTDSERAIDRATSGRLDLIGGGLRMVEDRPVFGFGSGAFAERYREREDVSNEQVAAASHTIPLTVAAEQGVIGLAAYLALVAIALALLFGGLRRALAADRQWPGVAAVTRAALAAAYCALILHTLVYAAFLEDPLAWVLLAIACGLRPGARVPEPQLAARA